jgi:hypothetical protein
MEAKQRFIALAKELEALKDKESELSHTLELLMKEIGIGQMFQDPDTGLVYRVQVPKGKYVYYQQLEYVRTAKPGESRGTLAKTEAKNAGFSVE